MTPLILLNTAACTVLLVHAACAINHMSRETHHAVRLAYILLAVGALGALAGPLYGHAAPTFSEALINAGATIALIVGAHHRHKKGWPQ